MICAVGVAMGTRCNAGAKHVRHGGQDSVDSTFFMKMMVNSVHIWSVDLVHVEEDAREGSLFKSQYKRIGANHATSLEVFFAPKSNTKRRGATCTRVFIALLRTWNQKKGQMLGGASCTGVCPIHKTVWYCSTKFVRCGRKAAGFSFFWRNGPWV